MWTIHGSNWEMPVKKETILTCQSEGLSRIISETVWSYDYWGQASSQKYKRIGDSHQQFGGTQWARQLQFERLG
jgi:hypothetical protein